MKQHSFKIIELLVLVFISTIGFVWLSERDIFHENMQTYSPAEIHAFDNSLYTHDIDVMTSHDVISPRIGSISIVSTLMHLGLSYEKVYLILFYMTCFFAAIGGVVFVHIADISNKLLGVLIYTIVFGVSRIHNFADFYVFTTNSIFIGLGSALGILATILVLCKPTISNLNIAYLLIGVASVCHIHEGIWSFVFVSLIYLISFHKLIPYKCASFYIAIITILVLTIPSLLSEQYSLSTSDFFTIYVKERIPHHLLLSYNGWTAILSLAITWCVLIYLNNSRIIEKGQYNLYLSLVGLFVVTLCAWYGFTEVLHISAFVKLYVAKFVKYISIPFCLLLVMYIDDVASSKKDWLLLASIILCLFVEREVWLYTLLLANFVAWLPIKKKYNVIVQMAFVIISVFLFVFDSRLASLPTRSILLVGCVVSFLQPFLMRDAILLVITIGGWIGHIYVHTHSLSMESYIHYRMKNKAGEDVCVISQDINNVVPKDQLILCNALSIEDGFIQHISRRSMYALYKTVPSSDLGIKIWHDRIVETKDFCQWAPEHTAIFMREKELKYVTINVEEMANLYDDCSLFAKVAEQGSYILYKLQ